MISFRNNGNCDQAREGRSQAARGEALGTRSGSNNQDFDDGPKAIFIQFQFKLSKSGDKYNNQLRAGKGGKRGELKGTHFNQIQRNLLFDLCQKARASQLTGGN